MEQERGTFSFCYGSGSGGRSKNSSFIDMDPDEKHVYRTDIYECVQFGADPNKNQDFKSGFIRRLSGLAGVLLSNEWQSSFSLN